MDTEWPPAPPCGCSAFIHTTFRYLPFPRLPRWPPSPVRGLASRARPSFGRFSSSFANGVQVQANGAACTQSIRHPRWPVTQVRWKTQPMETARDGRSDSCAVRGSRLPNLPTSPPSGRHGHKDSVLVPSTLNPSTARTLFAQQHVFCNNCNKRTARHFLSPATLRQRWSVEASDVAKSETCTRK
ncbi:hypothetical protein B0H67DRAFT_288717 [Lasiosphaeris hirsuta]|uniref:Uncharacterized protein n=1 Tax=Lasiosphaeris hirsuta TaxID=260670 RepID=A0AA40A8W6_9PEZI|nr:hypothetical protein B0H67DRAFT_288717 [Lasiosphaeris hirsuta]